MKIEYLLEAEDLAKYFEYMFWSRPERKAFRRGIRLRIALIYPTLAFIMYFTLFKGGSVNIGIVLAIVLVVIVVLQLLVGPLYSRSYRMQGKTTYKQNIIYQHKSTIEFLPESVVVSDVKMKTEFRYDAIEQVQLTETLLLLFVSYSAAYIIPIRSIQNQSSVEEVMSRFNQEGTVTDNPKVITDHLLG